VLAHREWYEPSQNVSITHNKRTGQPFGVDPIHRTDNASKNVWSGYTFHARDRDTPLPNPPKTL